MQLRSDGRDNLLDALIVCGEYIIPEVLTEWDSALGSSSAVIVCVCVCVCVCTHVCRSAYSSMASSFVETVAASLILHPWTLSLVPTFLPWPSWRLILMVGGQHIGRTCESRIFEWLE